MIRRLTLKATRNNLISFMDQHHLRKPEAPVSCDNFPYPETIKTNFTEAKTE
jgi:hypothetical protein